MFDPKIMKRNLHLLTEDEKRAMPPEWRKRLGVPDPDRGFFRRLVEDTPYLRSRKLLRAAFGLDSGAATIDPPVSLDEPYMGRSYSWYQEQMRLARDRNGMYLLYEEMDDYGVIATILDLYAEDATQTDPETGRVIWCESDNEQVKQELLKMFDRIGADDLAPMIVRAAFKLGDNFEQVITSRENGVEAIKFVYPTKVSRVEDAYGRLVGFAPGLLSEQELQHLANNQTEWESLNLAKPWDFVHFRFPNTSRDSIHGGSLLAPARGIWRQLKIMEDCVVLYRVNRAPDRMVYYIGVGADMGVEDRMRIAQDYANGLRRRMLIDRQTNALRQEFAAVTVDEDIVMTVGGEDDKTRVEKLAGSSNTTDVADVKYYLRKLFGSLRVPPAYLGIEDEINAKATLSAEDIRFARGAKKGQRVCIYGFTQVARIHLSLRGIDPRKKENFFRLRMAPISTLDEAQRAELVKVRLEVAGAMVDLGMKMNLNRLEWFEHVLTNHLMLSKGEARRYLYVKVGQDVRSMPPVPAGSEPEPTADTAQGTTQPISTSIAGPGEARLTADEMRKIDEAVGRVLPPERLALLREAARVLGAEGEETIAIREGELPPVTKPAQTDGESGETKAEGTKADEPLVYDLDAELGEEMQKVFARDRARQQPVLSSCPTCNAPAESLRVFESSDRGEHLACTKCGLCAPVRSFNEPSSSTGRATQGTR